MKDLMVIILSKLSQYLERFVRLFSGPKTFALALDKHADNALAQSFTFLGISSLENNRATQLGRVLTGRDTPSVQSAA